MVEDANATMRLNDPLLGFRQLISPDQTTVDQIAKLLLDDDLSIVWGLFLSSPAEDLESVVSIVLKFFAQHKRDQYLIQQAITQEIQQTLQLATLFRHNTFASKLLSCYTKRFGLGYLDTVLNECIETVCMNHQKDPDWSCEVNECRLEADKKYLLDSNFAHLEELTSLVLNNILVSYSSVPQSFRLLCAHLKRETEQKFPGEYPATTFASIGGFMFLRFICPALVVPHKYGLLEIAPGKVIARDLMMVSKVLQTIANGVLFGKKEGYLLRLNDFVEEYQPRILQFFDHIAESESRGYIPLRKDVVAASMDDAMSIRDKNAHKFPTTNKRRSKSYEPVESNLLCERGPLAPRIRRKGRRLRTTDPMSNIPATKQDSRSVSPVKTKPNSHSSNEELNDVTACNPSTKVSGEHYKPLKKRQSNWEGHTFSYGELMGIIQYLTVYWHPMKAHLVKMDDNSTTKHLETYIQLSILLQKLGVTSQEVIQQFSQIAENKSKKKTASPLKTLFSKRRKP